MSPISGLAAEIRAAKESESFDLGGQNVTTITSNIRAAFTEPLVLDEMIRLTFVTGAGKQARQKYDDGAARAVTSTLRELDYEEDRAASCVMECAGTFKLQHDTGKNLKTVVVFPKIQIVPKDSSTETTGSKNSTLFPPSSPEYRIATSSLAVFQRMLLAQCPSWSQKKGCMLALEALLEIRTELEGNLMKGTPLEDAQQDFYDNVVQLEDKIATVKTEMHAQVEEHGNLTAWEKDVLLGQNIERIQTLQNQVETSKKPKKVELMLEKALQRKQVLMNITPKQPHKLRYEGDMNKLRSEMLPLLRLQESTSGRLRSVKETQSLARLDEIWEEIAQLEEASRGWFEDEESFDSRVAASQEAFAARVKLKNKKINPPSSYRAAVMTANSSKKAPPATMAHSNNFLTIPAAAASTKMMTSRSVATAPSQPTSTTNKWVTPIDNMKKGKAAAKKKTKVKGPDVFSAMMMESDSDDDDDEEEETPRSLAIPEQENPKENPKKTENAPPIDSAATNTSDKKKKKSKKKKKKGSGENAATTTTTGEDEDSNTNQALTIALDIAQNYILPLLLAILSWFISMLFGKKKHKKTKTK